MTRQQRRGRHAEFNRQRRHGKSVPPPQPSGLTMEKFKLLTHDHVPTQAVSREVITEKELEEIEEWLHAETVTIPIDEEFIHEGFYESVVSSGTEARSHKRDMLEQIFLEHSKLLDTGATQYELNTEHPTQGGMSMTFFLRQKRSPLQHSFLSTTNNHDHDFFVAVDDEGTAINIGEEDAVMRCRWLSSRRSSEREWTIREIAALKAQGKLRQARTIRFSGYPPLKNIQIIQYIERRSDGESLDRLEQHHRFSSERQRPELSIPDMYKLMQSTRAWLVQLYDMQQRGVQHRDIKPEHLFVNYDHPEQSDIIDWGLMKPLKSNRRFTPDYTIGGTIPYLSSLAARGLPDPNRDIHALGLSLGVTLRLFFLHDQHSSNINEQVARMVSSTMYDMPSLITEHFHEQLQSWSTYFPEREFAFLVYRMVQEMNSPIGFNGKYDDVIVSLDSILTNMRLWTEAMKAIQDCYQRLKDTSQHAVHSSKLDAVHTALEYELSHGTPQTMRPVLAEYRRIITQLQQPQESSTSNPLE